MEIQLNLREVIGESEKRLLKNVLGCQNDEELQEAITKISKAAAYEYLEMMLGKQLPTRANEMRERRLYHLLKHYFVGRIPNETEISSIFQLTDSDSKSLLRNVKTKYKFDLEEELLSTIQLTLSGARQQAESYRVVIKSENILEELKQKVSVIAAELDQIQKVKNSAGVYNIPEDTYVCLCSAYRIPINDDTEVAATTEE